MKYLKIVKVTTGTNDAAVMQVVNCDLVESIVTAANTCQINYKGAGAPAGAVKTVITHTGSGKAIGDAVMSLLGKGHMHQGTVDVNIIPGGVTTILSS